MDMSGLLWAVGISLISGLLVNVVTFIFEKDAKRRPWHWVLGLSTALIVFMVMSVINGKPSTEATGTQSTPASASSIPTPTASESTPPPSSPVSPPVSTAKPVAATSLLDLPIADQATKNLIDLEHSSTTSINGTAYGRALRYECSIYCDGTSPQVFEVTLGEQFKTFTAWLGVLDTKTGEHRIDIILDQGAPISFTANQGPPTRITLGVEDVSRMTIWLYAPAEFKSPLQAGADSTIGENGDGLPGMALADPIVLP